MGVMGVIGVAGKVMEGMQARNAAKSAEAAQINNNRIIRQAAASSYGDLASSERFTQSSRHKASMLDHAQFLKAKGEVLVQAGASGTYGGAVNGMIQDLMDTKGRNLATINSNARKQMDDYALQKENIALSAQRGQGTKTFAKPSMAMIGISAIQAGVQGYQAGQGLSDSLALAAPAGGVESSNWDLSMQDFGGIGGR